MQGVGGSNPLAPTIYKGPTQGLASAASAGGATITATIAGVSGGTNLTVSQGVSPIALGVFPGNDNGNPLWDLYRTALTKNVKFIWCPNVNGPSWQTNPTTSLVDYYPGNAYVDWMALDGYNSFGAPWWQFSYIFSPSYAELVAINPTKPIMVAETASEFSPPDGNKAAWINNMETDIPAKFPNIHALSWFNDNGYAAPGYPPNLYRFDSDAGSQAAFQNLASDPKWQGAGLGVW